MNIVVGQGPDFKMMRGKESLSHAATVEITKSKVIFRRFVTDFSLWVVCKSIQEIRDANLTQISPTGSLRNDSSGPVVRWGVMESTVSAHIKLPSDLGGKQRADIVSFIRNIFK